MTTPGTPRGTQVSGVIRRQWADGRDEGQASLTHRVHLEILTDKDTYMLVQ